MSRPQRASRVAPSSVQATPSLTVYTPGDGAEPPQVLNATRAGTTTLTQSLAVACRCSRDVTLWELKSFWLRPMTYGLLLALSVVACWSFAALVTTLSRGSPLPEVRAQDDPVFRFLSFDLFLGGTGTLLVPILTMSLIAEERRRGSWETLLASAPNPAAVIVGKFIAGWCQWLICLTPWFLLAAALKFWSGETQTVAGFLPWFSGTGLDFDPGPVLGGVLGLAVIGLTFIALGLFCSGLCRQTVSAGAIGFAAMLLVLFLSVLPRLLTIWNCPPEWSRFADRFSCWGHLAQFSQGAISPQILLGHLTATILLVWGTATVARTRDGA